MCMFHTVAQDIKFKDKIKQFSVKKIFIFLLE